MGVSQLLGQHFAAFQIAVGREVASFVGVVVRLKGNGGTYNLGVALHNLTGDSVELIVGIVQILFDFVRTVLYGRFHCEEHVVDVLFGIIQSAGGQQSFLAKNALARKVVRYYGSA